jgi:hypothetical protein
MLAKACAETVAMAVKVRNTTGVFELRHERSLRRQKR